MEIYMNNNDVNGATRFIEILGTKTICNVCKVTPQALTRWKRQGIPTAWALYFSLKFKKEWELAFSK